MGACEWTNLCVDEGKGDFLAVSSCLHLCVVGAEHECTAACIENDAWSVAHLRGGCRLACVLQGHSAFCHAFVLLGCCPFTAEVRFVITDPLLVGLCVVVAVWPWNGMVRLCLCV